MNLINNKKYKTKCHCWGVSPLLSHNSKFIFEPSRGVGESLKKINNNNAHGHTTVKAPL